MIFKRKIYDKILQWKRENNGKTALLIEGARRIGKSTIVEEFAKNEYKSYILIDFNKTSEEVKKLFDNLMDLDYIFLFLQTVYKKKLEVRNSLIIFDEVQKCPNARQAIKYLVQDGRYDYIETGSLISIKKNVESITIPSEEDRISMYPMDYEEFCWAVDDNMTFSFIKKYWEDKKSLGDMHREMMRRFRLYMLVGGMPQAVLAYLETNNFNDVDIAKRRILKLYEEDLQKIDTSGKLAMMFNSIPGMLAKNDRRYVTSKVLGNINEELQDDLLQKLDESKIVNVAYHTSDPNVGMSLTKDKNIFKLFLCDTGLFVTLAFYDKSYTENVIYQKLLSDKLSVNLGYIFENIVAQLLVSSGNKLFYHTWERDEKHFYEIDFLLSRGNKICPVEVKSSGYKTHASLDVFRSKFSQRIANSFLVYSKDFQKGDNELMYVPTYMSSLL